MTEYCWLFDHNFDYCSAKRNFKEFGYFEGILCCSHYSSM
jgi:hypothetical protein